MSTHRLYLFRTWIMLLPIITTMTFVPNNLPVWRMLGILVASAVGVIIAYHCGRIEAHR